jgi:hypothetical protein
VDAQLVFSEVIMPAGLFSALPVIVAIVVLPSSWRVDVHEPGNADAHRAWRLFDAAVSHYVEIRRLHEPIDIDCLPADLEGIQRARERLAAAIREGRGEARQGDVFRPDVASLIRARLVGALRTHPYDPVLFGGRDTGVAPARAAIAVNRPLPWGIAISLTPSLLAELPELRDELEYRLVGRDLVLWDARTDLVVDVLFDALPAL